MVLVVTLACDGFGSRCGFESVPAPVVMSPLEPVPMLWVSASITQSALPAISAFVASKSTLLVSIASAGDTASTIQAMPVIDRVMRSLYPGQGGIPARTSAILERGRDVRIVG